MRFEPEPFVYKNRHHQNEVVIKNCRHAVHQDFGGGFRQCIRKGKITVSGYLFCAQHAKMAEREIENSRQIRAESQLSP